MFLANQETNLGEIVKIQLQLKETLATLTKQLENRLKPEELNSIRSEYQILIDLFESLKDGKIKIALFGKTNAGKSSVANSILGSDIYNVDVGMGAEVKAKGIIDHGKWRIIDSPGFMYSQSDDNLAIQNIKGCHGRIFVIDSEPFEPELKMFDDVVNFFDSPTIVFFNKWDVIQRNMPTKDREKIKQLVIQKMSKYVVDPSHDIIFGSARIYDSSQDKFVRQENSELINRMYETTGDLGLVLNIINPAERASGNINAKIYEIRENAARRVIDGYAKACAWGALIPYSSLISTPLIIHEMNIAICKIMGVNEKHTLEAAKVSQVFWKAILESMKVEALWSTAAVILAPFTFGSSLLSGAISTAAEWDNNVLKTQVVGEALLEYIRSDFKPIIDVNEFFASMKQKIKQKGLYAKKI